MTATEGGPKPHPTSPGQRAVRLELSESAGRWELVVHTDAASAEALRASGLTTGLALTLTVQPNLVPGEPFEIATVRVAGEADAPAADRQRPA